jgi:MAF protein
METTERENRLSTGENDGAAGSSAQVLLASGSPRRRVMLEAAGVRLCVRPVDVDETPTAGEAPEDFARRMAAEKACAGVAARSQDDPRWVLASDTVVTVDGAILGKPADAAEALAMLGQLRGRTHTVLTAFALAAPGRAPEVAHTASAVRFVDFDRAAAEAYVASGEPMDKAGAYGVQGGGGQFVDDVDGSYDGVIGLPLAETLEALIEVGALPAFPTDVARRLAIVRGRIAAAAQAAGRRAEDIVLVGASKAQPVERLRAALDAGLRDLGENYVQEWRDKADALGDGPRWHFIGHLQRNKAKYVAGRVHLIHGVDSVALGQALAKRAGDTPVRVLVQVNIGDEDTKSGVAAEGLGALLAGLDAVEGLRVDGLMAVPPPAGLVATRRRFDALRALRDAHAHSDRPLPSLSMGMSDDFPAAIACGATHVRVGTALFGPRG